MWTYNTAARVSTGSSGKETPDTTAEASPAKVSISHGTFPEALLWTATSEETLGYRSLFVRGSIGLGCQFGRDVTYLCKEGCTDFDAAIA